MVDAATNEELADAGLLPFCGEWVDVAGEPQRCTARAEFILWGKLIPADGLGPRCYDHAAKHIGHCGLNRPGKNGWAVADLRPLIRQTGGSSDDIEGSGMSEQLELVPQPPKLSTCRSCRRSIIWTRTERGKKMPLDADPVEDQTQASLFVLRERENRDGPLAVAAWGLVGLEDHYVSHFATCPNADQHRQPPQDPGWRDAGRKYRDPKR